MKGGVFSPLTRTATVIEIESDEEKKQPSPVVSRTLNNSLTRTETEYSFEDDYMDNPEFLRELERAESIALSQQHAPSASAGPSRARPSQNPTQSQVTYDTIEIDTDKENDSVMKRVKRKVMTKRVAAVPNQSVISIEDSD